ncbi:hypothetical protein O3P69_003094 [Scylla paramamosain]|uniref:Tafazzin family protein n=1 Tax=Scylla paramamosain TaxID=85552 RepID=A0AAW0UMF2_SCYPA
MAERGERGCFSAFGWPFPDMKDPPLSFKLRSIFVIPMVSTFSKILLSLCNIINGHNVECLQEMVEKRLKGTSLVTVSNHYSCTDDPALWVRASKWVIPLG